jgi:hypothetical protein
MLRGVNGSGGGAPVGGSGTAGTIPVWTATASTLGDSLLSQSGAIVTNSGTFRAASGAVGEPAYTFAASTGTGMYRATSNALLRFAVSGAYAFGVDTIGNVGIGTASPGTRLHVLASAPAIATIASSNATQGYIQFNYNSTTTFGYIGNGTSVVNGGANGDFSLRSDTGVISFATGGNTERMRIDSSGNVYAASGTTGMTNGFFYIPGAAGAPTGTPTAVTGRVPMYYDTTNNKFYVYNGAWKQVALT